MPTVQQYRSDLDELVRLANRDLAAMWRQIADAAVARDALAEILPLLTAAYGSAAATLAADWYDELRAEKAVRGRFRAIAAELPGAERTDVLARWAVEPLFSDTPDFVLARDKAAGGLQRIIADAGRDTVMQSSIADPQARGWQRVASGGCGFCSMLAARGAVYSEATVSFGAHDHCRCAATPAFGGEPLPVKAYVPGPRQATPADRARTRAWIADNGL